MKKKKFIAASVATVFFVALATYIFAEDLTEPPSLRNPASGPSNYEALGACEKQEILWQKIVSSKHAKLPDNRKLGFMQVLAMSRQEIALKGENISDFSPKGWKKYLHGRGSIAKIKVVPSPGSNYTGIFSGADCGLLRLSLTYSPKGSKPVAPGLALKVLRNGTYSANISALVSLDGQSKDFNFFSNPMSNIVAAGDSFGQKWVHSIFSKVSDYPEELLVTDMAMIDASGTSVAEMVSPRQLIFIPGESLSFSHEEHEVREDFHKIPVGTVIYKIFAVDSRHKDFDYSKYTAEHLKIFLKEAVPVAELVSTSEFISSEFGDDGIFFRHQIRGKY